MLTILISILEYGYIYTYINNYNMIMINTEQRIRMDGDCGWMIVPKELQIRTPQDRAEINALIEGVGVDMSIYNPDASAKSRTDSHPRKTRESAATVKASLSAILRGRLYGRSA